MTYIEFFGREAAENISACITYAPERVIYIGNTESVMERCIAKYSQILAERGTPIEFQHRTVSKSDLDEAVAALSQIVKTYDDCVFDITGGEEILNVALGVVCERYPDKNLQIHKWNLRDNVIYDCAKDGTVVRKDAPALSVEENIRIHGGDVVYGGIWEDNTYRWELSEDFKNDIDQMWDICREKPRRWNAQIHVFEAVEKVGSEDPEQLTTTADISQVKARLESDRGTYQIYGALIDALKKTGLLTAFEEGADTLTVSYKNAQVKKCLTKAGTVLEMKMLLVGKNAKAKGVPVYDDAMNGVVIDWDGMFHDEETEDMYDTENEIDLLLMHGLTPVFVSCKNGDIKTEELYKLHTVATRFGGRYAKKVLVTTCLSKTSKAGRYFRQRAKDMRIEILEDLKQCNDAQLEKKFRKLWKH